MGLQAFPSGGVKNVQRGTATLNGTTPVNVTISSVVMVKTSVNLLTAIASSSGTNFSYQLTSSTNLQITSQTNGVGAIPVSWEVIEYY